MVQILCALLEKRRESFMLDLSLTLILCVFCGKEQKGARQKICIIMSFIHFTPVLISIYGVQIMFSFMYFT